MWFLKAIGKKLRKLRGEKTVKEVAEALGVTRQSIWNYENDIRVPKDEMKVKIAKLYNSSVQEIFFSWKKVKKRKKVTRRDKWK